MGSSQGGWQGKKNASQGYQVQRLASTPGVESLHICNDSTGAQVKERAKEHIQASKPSNIIATSHYGVPVVVRSTNQV
jgi:hypothetical protein